MCSREKFKSVFQHIYNFRIYDEKNDSIDVYQVNKVL